MKRTLLFTALLLLVTFSFAQIPTDGLEAYWPFNGNANDESGNNHNGIVNGAALTSDRFGITNNAYSFDGIDDYIDFFGSSEWCSGSHTISFWFNSEFVNGRDQFVLAKRNSCLGGSENYFEARISTTANSLSIGWGKSGAYFSVPFLPNIWNNITYVIDESNSFIYLNGSLIEEKTYSSYINDVPLRVGNHACTNAQNDEYLGLLDDIRLYNRAITFDEQLSIYREGFCYETVYDTITTELFDTTIVSIYDTITTQVFDTTLIIVYDSISVTDTLIIDVTLTDIDSDIHNTIKVYPNPAKDFVIIHTGQNFNLMNDYTIKIVSLTGTTVFESNITMQQFEIDANDFGNTGLFLIQILDENNNIVENRKLLLE